MKPVKPLVFSLLPNPDGTWEIHLECSKIVGSSGCFLHCCDPQNPYQMTIIGDSALSEAYETVRDMMQP